MKPFYIILCFVVLLGWACEHADKDRWTELPTVGAFADTVNGRVCRLFVLKNSAGMEAAFCTYGARLVRVLADGVPLVQGMDSLCQYRRNADSCMGSMAGVYCKAVWNGIQTNDTTVNFMYGGVRVVYWLEEGGVKWRMKH